MPEDVATSLRLGDAKWDTDGQTLVWLEGRSGVGVLVAQTGEDAPRDLTTEINLILKDYTLIISKNFVKRKN